MSALRTMRPFVARWKLVGRAKLVEVAISNAGLLPHAVLVHRVAKLRIVTRSVLHKIILRKYETIATDCLPH